LEGLDLEELPKRLTEAFADIVSARIRLRGSVTSDLAEGLATTLHELRRLAATHEAYVALLPERENRAAAAFVAASAHTAFMLGIAGESAGSKVDVATLSPDVCATLLFLIAEAHADAAESAKRISTNSPDSSLVERALLKAIRNLAQGQLFAIVSDDIPDIAGAATDVGEHALQALLLLLLRGVRSLAMQLRRRVNISAAEGGVEPAATIFARVKALCMEPIVGFDISEQVFSLYPGPLHLANLLLAVERDLMETALTRIPTPGGVPEQAWWQVLRRMARQRPFLWRNHRVAIDSGYLEIGTSSAISFPTGGGKSTLAELKIATSLLRDKKVVFLAPTHALVGQTTRALKKTFQNYEVFGDLDDEITFTDVVVLPEVTVTTPERCLMLLSLQPEAFSDLGLIVFDECHLLHPREEDRSRRGLDAMLAILNLTQLAPDADLLLLSAMMKNTGEIAGWLKELTGRGCLTLDLAWKPTRQVRGCVVYPAEQITALRSKLTQARVDLPGQISAPSTVKKELQATPYGLFSLLQTWSTVDRHDYALLPLLSAPQRLSTGTSKGGNWYLTPNGNETSSAIAAAAAVAGMKSLVFVQTTIFCESCVKKFSAKLKVRKVKLNDEETKWRDLTVEEMGGPQYCYLQLDAENLVTSGAASHHSLLLREERELHESLFKRRGGVDVMFATSTLAQGMNLPSEIVIISGDSRFDPGADKMKRLEAHELLNAAGRAGRAGEGAQGFVLLVPSKVIDFDDKKSQISGHWMELQAIFEQADQCLVIDDPVEDALDQIHDGITKTGIPAYLVSKLPLSIAASTEDAPAAVLLKRTFAAYRARIANDEDWLNSRISAAVTARATVELPDKDKWIEQVASSTGLSVPLLQELVVLSDLGSFDGSTTDVMAALLKWLEAKSSTLMDIVRPESLEGLFGEKYKKLPSDVERAHEAIYAVAQLLPLWMSGAPLCDLEAVHLGRKDRLGRCEYSRHFASRIIPEFAFVAGLPARLITARAKHAGESPQLTTVILTLSGCVREGCDSPDALATRVNCGRDVSRVAAKQLYEKIKGYALPGLPTEDFDQTRDRMRNAQTISTFA
jgi:superfamily II DNA/RNA helicase